jgi:hypothetical protein
VALSVHQCCLQKELWEVKPGYLLTLKEEEQTESNQGGQKEWQLSEWRALQPKGLSAFCQEVQ